MPIQIRSYAPDSSERDSERLQTTQLPFRSRLHFLRLLLPSAAPHFHDNGTGSDTRINAHRHFRLRNIERLTDLNDSEDESSDEDSAILSQSLRRQGTDIGRRHSEEDSSRGVSTDVYENESSEAVSDIIENFEGSFFNEIYIHRRSSLEEEILNYEADDQVVQDIIKKRVTGEKDSTIYLTADGNYDPMVSFIARVLDITFRGAPRRGIVCCKDVLPMGDEQESHLDPRGLDAIMDKLNRIIEDIPSSSAQGNHIYEYIVAIDDTQRIDR